MGKLNQVLAVEKGVKSSANKRFTEIYHLIQKQPLLSGIARSYTPKDQDGDQLPSESTKVQVKASEILDEVRNTLTDLFDVTATKDWGNLKATADVKVGSKVLVEAAPVTYLLWLEKQLVDLHTVISKVPTLDPTEEWEFDDAQDCYRTVPTETVRTKKIPRNHVKAEATDKHPAQVEVYHEDVVMGYWKTIKYSGALPASRVNELLRRVEQLQNAVKTAREEANSIEVQQKNVGSSIFDWLLAP